LADSIFKPVRVPNPDRLNGVKKAKQTCHKK